VKTNGCVVKIEGCVVKKVTFSLYFHSSPHSVPTLPVALREAAYVADNVLTWSL
jgi:hypothetical protein